MFGTSGVRGRFGKEITAGLALSIGRALVADGADRVVVGRDPRTTGPLLADALAAGIRECGGEVTDVGMASTPTIARSVAWVGADAGVSITASHNPPTDNGIKLWTPSGMAFDADRRARITELVERDAFEPAAWDAVGDRESFEGAIDRHAAAIAAAVDPVDGLRVLVDIGNGAGGVTVRALRAIGCTVETLNEGPDGRFPARPSEPTAENCRTLAAAVAATDADLGIAHDGDADRMMAVDETGSFVPGDALLALFARDVADAGGRVAMPVNTSLAVEDALAAIDASVVRTRVGDVYVAEAAREDGVVFGGEPSGAWIWPAATLCPDGPFAAAQLAAFVDRAGPLSDAVGAIEQYPIRRESHETTAKAAVMETVADRLTAAYDSVSTIDGVRVETDDGWFLVRASGTEPIVRVTAEARTDDRADELAAIGRSYVTAAIDEHR